MVKPMQTQNRMITIAASAIVIWMTFYLLIVGQSLLMPFVIAVFIWNLLNTLNLGIRHTPHVGKYLPNWLSRLLSLVVIAGLLIMLVNIIGDNVNDVVGASSRYQHNLKQIFSQIDQRNLSKIVTGFDRFLDGLNIQGILLSFYGVFTSIASSAVITLYIVFLFVEQRVVKQKLTVLFPQKEHRLLIDSMIVHIGKDIQSYLGIKSLMGLLTALASWAIMTAVGLDFAEFWALLIFFLNYIPNIGAIVATLFPAILALIQFQTWVPFVIMTSGLVVVQFIIGNLIEPRYLGRSLNLSPLVILIALGLWGQIWGVLGMFLSVPITVILMIIFAHFESTRPLAILLSQDGQIKKAYYPLNIK